MPEPHARGEIEVGLVPPTAAQAIAALQAACCLEAWGAAAIARLLGEKIVFGLFATIGRLEQGGSLAGFALCRVAAGEGEILSLGVHPQARRIGVAGRLLARVEEEARRRSARAIYLEVAASNVPAAALYARHGFFEVGRRPGYYEGREKGEDARVLRLSL